MDARHALRDPPLMECGGPGQRDESPGSIRSKRAAGDAVYAALVILARAIEAQRSA